MPGRRAVGWHPGYRCEYAARYALSAYASTVPIPMQEDYGHDLYCLLTKKQGRFLIPRFPFFVQIKKNDSRDHDIIDYDNSDAVSWLLDFNLPFYIGLCYLDKNARLDLYKTSERIPLGLKYGTPKSVSLQIGDNPEKRYDENNIWMGEPIISLSLDHCSQGNDLIAESLFFWVNMDLQNLIIKSNNLTMYCRCKTYETNQKPDNSDIELKHFWNTAGLTPGRKERFGSILRNLILWEFGGQTGNAKVLWADLPPKKQKLYQAFAQVLCFLSKEDARDLTYEFQYPHPD